MHNMRNYSNPGNLYKMHEMRQLHINRITEQGIQRKEEEKLWKEYEQLETNTKKLSKFLRKLSWSTIR